MRHVTGIALIDAGVTKWWGGPPFGPTILCMIATGAGVLLIVGLWTPIAGLLLVIIEVWKAFSPLRMEAHRHSRSKALAPIYLRVVFPLVQKGHTERPKGVASLPDVVGTMAPSRVVRMTEFVPYSSSRTNRVSLIAWMS